MSKIFVLLSVLALSFATTACGDSDGGNGGSSAACEANCDAQDALACENAMVDNDTCKQICAAYGAAGAECSDAAEAYYTCANALTWECGAMGAAPTDATACQTEAQAMNTACAAE